MISFCAKVEMEIAQLNNNDPNEAKEFMEALGIKEASRDKVIRAAYTLLKQIAFFTVGEDEVRAWTVTKDAPAQEAAGKIHSDIARGFIRAEVVAYSAIHDHGGWNQAKDKGLVRLEGKEYKVQDGDCINFRFNI
jgi:ribosome-binding ATPase YchF (GTP1/OBG family)